MKPELSEIFSKAEAGETIPTSELIQKLQKYFKPKDHAKVNQILSFLDANSEDIIAKAGDRDHTCTKIHLATLDLWRDPTPIKLDTVLSYIRTYLADRRIHGK